ncbi:MAG: Dps family protein [Anaerococcus sp.]
MNKELNNKLDLYLANLAVANIKFHNLHWNVTGFSFVRIHEFLEEVYDSILEKYDEIAEIQKMQGEYPKASMKEYLEITSIDEIENSKDIEQKEALKIALEYFKLQSEIAKEIRELADKDDNFQVANAMEDHLEEYSQQIWFIESSLK